MIVKQTLEKLGIKIQKDNGKYYSLNCPWRESSDSQSFLIDGRCGYWFDSVTGESGSFDRFICGVLGRSMNERELTRWRKIEDELDFDVTVKFPMPDKIYSESSLINLLPNYSYPNKRKISDETAKTFELGVAQSGQLYQRLVFPIRNKDKKIVGFTGRALDNQRQPKYKHIGHSSKFTYPIHLNDSAGQVIILVESPFDVLYLWEKNIKNCYALFGLKLGGNLLSHLISCNPKKILISTNNEESGRGNDAANKIKLKLNKFFDNNKTLVCLPKSKDWAASSDKDINELKEYIEKIK